MLNNNKSFGEIVYNHRKAKGLTVQRFLKALGKISNKGSELSPAYITKIEVYDEIPKPEIICKIAEVLDIDVKRLLELAKASKIKYLERNITSKFEIAT